MDQIKFYGNAKSSLSNSEKDLNPLSKIIFDVQNRVSSQKIFLPHSILNKEDVKNMKLSNILYPLDAKVAYSSGNEYHENIKFSDHESFLKFANIIFAKDADAEIIISKSINAGDKIVYFGKDFAATDKGGKYVFTCNMNYIFEGMNLRDDLVYICHSSIAGVPSFLIKNVIPRSHIDLNEFENVFDFENMSDDDFESLINDLSIFLTPFCEPTGSRNDYAFMDGRFVSKDMKLNFLSFIASKMIYEYASFFESYSKNSTFYHLISKFTNKKINKDYINIVNFIHGDGDINIAKKSIKNIILNKKSPKFININFLPTYIPMHAKRNSNQYKKVKNKMEKLKNINQIEYIRENLKFPKIDTSQDTKDLVGNIDVENFCSIGKGHLRVKSHSSKSVSLRLQVSQISSKYSIFKDGLLIHEESNTSPDWIEHDISISSLKEISLLKEAGWQSISELVSFINNNANQNSLAGTNAKYCMVKYSNEKNEFYVMDKGQRKVVVSSSALGSLIKNKIDQLSNTSDLIEKVHANLKK